jgi:methylglyoxal synthase
MALTGIQAFAERIAVVALYVLHRALYDRDLQTTFPARRLAPVHRPAGMVIAMEQTPMTEIALESGPRKRIALVAHDNKKKDLLEWALFNRDLLVKHDLFATGTTGALIEKTLDTTVVKLQSGPLGGDQQIGAKIAEGTIDFVIFFWDPLEPQPHDPDVKALLRIAVVWNVPVACNRASADFMISSPLMDSPYERALPDYEGYRDRLKTTGA